MPGSLQAWANEAALIKEMHGTESEGMGAPGVLGAFCEDSCAALADDVRDGDNGSRTCGQKTILPNTQSINGL